MVLTTIIIFIALLAVLILVHEWGHFFVAKRAGIKVEEFGFGFPPRLFSLKKGDTVYSMNWVPLGGFVKIYGEGGEGKGEPESFSSKSVATRSIIVLAGVAMNFLFAAVLLSFGYWHGLPQVIDEHTAYIKKELGVTVVQVSPGSPAENAGIEIGDVIISLGSFGVLSNVSDVKEVQNIIASHKGKETTFMIQRGRTVLEKRAIPRVEAPKGEGPLGVALEKTGIVSYPWYEAPIEGVKATFSLTWLFLSAFSQIIANLVTEGRLIAEIAGPVGIGALTYQVTQLGVPYLIQFAAIISINLAIINALPFPALDGGRFLFLLIEGIKGSPVSQRFERAVHTAGFALLILLMLLVTARDIVKLF